jgi:hypothetical protein
MLALKRSLLFSSGGTGGDKEPPSGNEGGESVAATFKGVGAPSRNVPSSRGGIWNMTNIPLIATQPPH